MFEGASVLVTGGTRGIGKATLRFASLGATRIALGYMRGDGAAEAASELADLGSSPCSSAATSHRPRRRGSRRARAARRLRPRRGDGRHQARARDRGEALGLDARCERACPPLAHAGRRAVDAQGAAIVAISSLGSTRVLEDYALVGASKAALEALVRYLAVELAPRGIAVNAVSAGVVETGALEHFPRKDAMLELGRRNPVGRLVTPGDVAASVTFLCSPDAAMIRGQTLVIDGGGSLLLPMEDGRSPRRYVATVAAVRPFEPRDAEPCRRLWKS